MIQMTDKQFNNRLQKIQKLQKHCAQKNQLKSELIKCWSVKDKTSDKKFTMSKKITVYLFVILNALLVYSAIAMWHFEDLSYLGALITDVIGQLIVFVTYSVKATKENTVGGITYDMAMQDYLENSVDEELSDKSDETDDKEVYG